MKLYIANAKAQTESFTYRIPTPVGERTRGARVQIIPAGQQVEISGDLSRVEIDAIISQHAKYGLVAADELDRNRDFAGLCYSVDKPVTSSRIQRLMGTNILHLEEKGREQRALAAVATNGRLEDDLKESRVPGQLTNLEYEVVEQRSRLSDSPETTAERVRVSRDPEADSKRPRSRKAPPAPARRRKAG